MRLLPIVWLLGFTLTGFAQTNTTAPTPDSAAPSGQEPAGTAQQPPQAASHPVATTYSDAYETRLKIHKIASFATLPLFGTELALGQSLYNNPETGGRKTAHAAVGAGIVGLFGVNSVTGIWNLWESRQDADGRRLKVLHSVLMLVADGGFVATEATTPKQIRGTTILTGNPALHRDVAIGSISVATLGYLVMLFRH